MLHQTRGKRTAVEEDWGAGMATQHVAEGVPEVLGSSSRGRPVLSEAGMKGLVQKRGTVRLGGGRLAAGRWRELSEWKRWYRFTQKVEREGGAGCCHRRANASSLRQNGADRG